MHIIIDRRRRAIARVHPFRTGAGHGEEMTGIDWKHVRSPCRNAEFPLLGVVCRLGLATRGNTHLDAEDVVESIDRGVTYLNWCGHVDGMSAAVRSLGARRREVSVAIQLSSRSAREARKELSRAQAELGTETIDVVTYYYVEHEDEWEEISAPGGAAEALEQAKANGIIRSIGVTSHQRSLCARMAESGRLDMVMSRYNAAHCGAEADVFPITQRLKLPVVAFTGLRWRALLESTPEDPSDFQSPPAPEWYRFVLSHPAVTVGLMAPNGRAELEENLTILDDWRGIAEDVYRELRAHGERVRRHAGRFP